MFQGGYYGQSGHASYEEELGIQTMSTQTAALTVNHGDCSLVPSRNTSGPVSPLRVPHPTPVNPNYPHTPRANLASQVLDLDPGSRTMTLRLDDWSWRRRRSRGWRTRR